MLRKSMWYFVRAHNQLPSKETSHPSMSLCFHHVPFRCHTYRRVFFVFELASPHLIAPSGGVPAAAPWPSCISSPPYHPQASSFLPNVRENTCVCRPLNSLGLVTPKDYHIANETVLPHRIERRLKGSPSSVRRLVKINHIFALSRRLVDPLPSRDRQSIFRRRMLCLRLCTLVCPVSSSGICCILE